MKWIAITLCLVASTSAWAWGGKPALFVGKWTPEKGDCSNPMVVDIKDGRLRIIVPGIKMSEQCKVLHTEDYKHEDRNMHVITKCPPWKFANPDEDGNTMGDGYQIEAWYMSEDGNEFTRRAHAFYTGANTYYRCK